MLSPDLMKYVVYVLRRFWIVIIVATLLGGVGYIFFDRQDASYRAEAQVFIGNALDPNPDRTDVQTALLIVPTYAEFARTTSVLMTTIENLELDMSVASLRRRISTRIIVDTPILSIRATTNDPELSASIANEVARNLIAESPSSLTDAELQQMDSLRLQLEDLESQNTVTRAQSADLLEQLNNAEENGQDDDVIEQLRIQYAELVDRLNTSRGVVAQTSDTYIGLANRVGRLEIVEEAVPPRGSVGINPLLVGIVAAFIGVGGTTAMLLLYLEYFDDNIRTATEVKKHLKLPILGHIQKSSQSSAKQSEYLREGSIESLPIIEDYRVIQTKLVFGADEKASDKSRVYLIASPNSSEGRTFNVVNLAAVMASSGQKVLLIDANLRQPKLHTIFDMDNTHGLTEAFSANYTNDENYQDMIRKIIQDTGIKNLHVITSGIEGVPVSPQILSFDRFATFRDNVSELYDYDIILIDTPPSKKTSDSFSIAASSDTGIIMIVSYATTSIRDMNSIIEQFEHLRSKIVGVILNRM